MFHTLKHLFAGAILSIAPLNALAVPCGSWQPGSPPDGLTGINASVNAVTTWDRDGTGPQPPITVFAGNFSAAAGRPASNISAWDGSRWNTIGDGFNSDVFDVEAMPNGELLATGRFTASGSTPVRFIAKWNGSSWQDLGGNIDGVVMGALVLPDGSIMVCGTFDTIGGIAAHQVALYRNGTWSPVGTGLNGQVFDLTRAANGDIYANGVVSVPGIFQLGDLARWNGVTWSSVPSSGLSIQSIPAPLADGALMLGGSRLVDNGSGSQLTIIATATLNGTTWTNDSVLPEIQGSITSIAASNTRRFAAGNVRPPHTSAVFSLLPNAGPLPVPGGPNFIIASLMDHQQRLIVAGQFVNTLTGSGAFRRANRVMTYDGARWTTCSEGLDGMVSTILPQDAASALIGGNFRSFAGTVTGGVARWSNGTITPLASPLDRDVLALSSTSTGTVFAGLASEPNQPGSNLKQFNGSSWSDVGEPLNGSVRTLLTLPNGELIAGGDFIQAGNLTVNRIARWSNNAWFPFATGVGGSVHALARLPDGSIIAAGQFSLAGTSNVSNVALWNGRWWPLDTGLGARVNALVTMPDGTVIAAGEFTANGSFTRSLNRVARWVNNSWQPVGAGFNGSVKALHRRGNRLVATGEFTASGTTQLNRIAEWNGSEWQPFGTGLAGPVSSNTPAPAGAAITILESSDILVGGLFESAGGLPSNTLGWWHSCLSEFNCDGVTDFFDYLDFVQAFSSDDPRADIDGDGTVDFFDYLDFVRHFDAGC